MALELRPLTLGELLDRTFGLFRSHFWLFVSLMALPSVLVMLLNVGTVLVPEFVAASGTSDGPTPEMVATAFLGGLAIFALSILYFFAYVLTMGATSIAVSELYMGRQPTMARAYSMVRGYTGRLVVLMILIGLRLLGIFVLCMIPFAFLGVVVALGGGMLAPVGGMIAVLGMGAAMVLVFFYSLRYSVAVPAAVLEPVPANAAIRRSVSLIRQNYWRTAMIVVFAMIVTYAAMMIFQMPFLVAAAMVGPEGSTAVWLHLAGSVSGAIGGAVSGPVMIVGIAVLYFDLRIRKEGLDLQLMMANLDIQPEPDAAAPLPSIG